MAGDFIAVQCPECENEQTIFGNAATAVSCAVCGHQIASPRGGKASVQAEVLEAVQQR